MKLDHSCSAELKNATLAVTPARLAALQLFESHKKPIDAKHILDHLQKELGVDRVTVFRILNTFVSKGLIVRLEFGEGKARYELAKEDHHHIICESCGKVEDIEDTLIPQMESAVAKQTGFFIKRHTLEFYGLCQSCLKKRSVQ